MSADTAITHLLRQALLKLHLTQLRLSFWLLLAAAVAVGLEPQVLVAVAELVDTLLQRLRHLLQATQSQ
jgi:hypothetical protein